MSPPSRKAVYVENQIGEKQIEHTKIRKIIPKESVKTLKVK